MSADHDRLTPRTIIREENTGKEPARGVAVGVGDAKDGSISHIYLKRQGSGTWTGGIGSSPFAPAAPLV